MSSMFRLDIRKVWAYNLLIGLQKCAYTIFCEVEEPSKTLRRSVTERIPALPRAAWCAEIISPLQYLQLFRLYSTFNSACLRRFQSSRCICVQWPPSFKIVITQCSRKLLINHDAPFTLHRMLLYTMFSQSVFNQDRFLFLFRNMQSLSVIVNLMLKPAGCRREVRSTYFRSSSLFLRNRWFLHLILTLFLCSWFLLRFPFRSTWLIFHSGSSGCFQVDAGTALAWNS